MKKIAIFIGLKIAEIVGVILLVKVAWFLDKLLAEWLYYSVFKCTEQMDIRDYFVMGVWVPFFGSCLLGALGYACYLFIKMNWELAEDIMRKFRNR